MFKTVISDSDAGSQKIHSQYLENSKVASASVRLDLYREAWSMIKDFPLGVGPEQFEFARVPYAIEHEIAPTKDYLFKSPHNEFLRIAAEDGLIYAIIAYGLLVFIFSNFLISEFRKKDSKKFILLVPLLAVILIESMFHFPLENSYPFLIFLFLFSWTLFHSYPRITLSYSKPLKILSLFAIVGLSLLTFISSYSLFVQRTNPNDLERNRDACYFLPNNWRACLNVAHALMEDRNREAEEVLRKEIRKHPYNYFAIELLGWHLLERGIKADGCSALYISSGLTVHKNDYFFKMTDICEEEIPLMSEDVLDEHRDWLKKWGFQ